MARFFLHTPKPKKGEAEKEELWLELQGGGSDKDTVCRQATDGDAKALPVEFALFQASQGKK